MLAPTRDPGPGGPFWAIFGPWGKLWDPGPKLGPGPTFGPGAYFRPMGPLWPHGLTLGPGPGLGPGSTEAHGPTLGPLGLIWVLMHIYIYIYIYIYISATVPPAGVAMEWSVRMRTGGALEGDLNCL